MIRLLFITDTYIGGYAGSELFLHRLATKLDPKSFDIQVVQLTRKRKIPISKGYLAGRHNVRVHHLPVQRVYGISGIRALQFCRNLIRQDGADIVQSIHEKADIISALLPAPDGRPVKVSSRRDEGFKLTRKMRAISGSVNSRLDWFVTPAQATRGFVVAQESVPPDRCIVIENGVDTSVFRPGDACVRSRARQMLGVEAGAFVVACIASIKPVKNHELIVSAFGQLIQHKNGRTVRLVLIGDGELRDRIGRQVDECGLTSEVVFAGLRDAVHELIPGCDVIVSASNSEGMSNSLIESSACGIPVIASNVGGNPEVVQHGETGFLFPPGDVSKLTHYLKVLLEDKELREKIGERAAKVAAARFSIELKVRAYADLYRELAGTR